MPRRRFAAAALVALVLAGCSLRPAPVAAPAPLLNSERIEARFGSYGIEVLASGGRTRVSSLYSTHGERRVCRTFAVVLFPEVVDDRLASVHAEVLAGGSIGATLQAAGWSVEKEHLFLGTLPREDRLAAVYARMDIAPAALAVDVYRLTASRSRVAIAYATIAEAHHPDYLDLGRLRAIYDPARKLAAGPSREVEAILRAVADASIETRG